MILHDFPLSSACFRVRIALNLKGLSYEKRNYALREGEQRAPAYLKLNPAGLVPALEVDGIILGQSLAIIEYLDSTARVPRLIPVDPIARARAMEMALTIAADIHPINNLRILKYLTGELGVSEEARDDWYRHWVREGLVALERMAEGSGRYLGGDAPDLADICLVPQLFNARRFKLDLTPFPTLVRIDTALQELDAFASASPERTQSA